MNPCQHVQRVVKERGPHVGEFCAECGVWLRWIPRPLSDPGKFRLPFGRHKGESLAEVRRTDPEYLAWAASNLRGNVGRRCAEAMAGAA